MGVDYRRTSRRPQWSDLPDGVRALIAGAAGAPVAGAEPSVTSGFSGAFATVLHLADGRDVFAKAGSDVNPYLLRSHADEARVLAALPDGVPAPRLVGAAQTEAGEVDERAWGVIVIETVPGRMPIPWTDADLAVVHEACCRAAETLTPLSDALSGGRTMTERIGGDVTFTGTFAALAAGDLALTAGQPSWLPRRLADLDALASGVGEALRGQTGVHHDLRADNILITPGRGAVFVDWNYLMAGPPWLDWVCVIGAASGEGLDAGAWLARSPLTRGVDPEAIDAWLASLTGYFLAMADRPLFPGGLPAVRDHQRYLARVFAEWLGRRRGWR